MRGLYRSRLAYVVFVVRATDIAHGDGMNTFLYILPGAHRILRFARGITQPSLKPAELTFNTGVTWFFNFLCGGHLHVSTIAATCTTGNYVMFALCVGLISLICWE